MVSRVVQVEDRHGHIGEDFSAVIEQQVERRLRAEPQLSVVQAASLFEAFPEPAEGRPQLEE